MTTSHDSTGAASYADDLDPQYLTDLARLIGQARAGGWDIATIRQALAEWTGDYTVPPAPLRVTPDVLPDLLADLRRRADHFTVTGKPIMGWSTGIPTLDDRLGGLQAGRMTVLLAQPGMGKTSLSAQLAAYIASQGAPVLYVSYENTSGSLLLRMVAAGSGIPVRAVERGEFPIAQVAAAIERFRGRCATLAVVDGGRSTTIDVIERYARDLRQRFPNAGAPVLFVDYMQRLASTDLILTDARMRVEQTSARLSDLAKTIEGHVVAISSTNRAAYQTKDSRPGLASARESGAIEFDADHVLSLAKPEAEGGGTPMGKDALMLEISKNRHGEAGKPILLYRDWSTLAVSEPETFDGSVSGRNARGRAAR